MSLSLDRNPTIGLTELRNPKSTCSPVCAMHNLQKTSHKPSALAPTFPVDRLSTIQSTTYQPLYTVQNTSTPCVISTELSWLRMHDHAAKSKSPIRHTATTFQNTKKHASERSSTSWIMSVGTRRWLRLLLFALLYNHCFIGKPFQAVNLGALNALVQLQSSVVFVLFQGTCLHVSSFLTRKHFLKWLEGFLFSYVDYFCSGVRMDICNFRALPSDFAVLIPSTTIIRIH